MLSSRPANLCTWGVLKEECWAWQQAAHQPWRLRYLRQIWQALAHHFVLLNMLRVCGAGIPPRGKVGLERLTRIVHTLGYRKQCRSRAGLAKTRDQVSRRNRSGELFGSWSTDTCSLNCALVILVAMMIIFNSRTEQDSSSRYVMIHINDAPGSNFGLCTSYKYWIFSWFYSIPARKVDIVPSIFHERFLPNSF
jgi:hypothetical protein